MSRRKFIEEHGATCANWNWSWSFVNGAERFVIFGAWDINTDLDRAVILRDKWEVSSLGKRNLGYSQALEHVRLVDTEGFRLFTFPIEHSGEDGNGPARIKSFEPVLTERLLLRDVGAWYAVDTNAWVPTTEEEIRQPGFPEGALRVVTVTSYERSSKARAECLRHYGHRCSVCDMDFASRYGQEAARIMHVHHLIPLGQLRSEYVVDPIKDLRPVCPNCHAVIHTQSEALSIERVRAMLASV
ncbi:MAG: HNH endonuclease [Armatimonadetes bacterium]|nr:HNH endonuclease [Armatimonadota bacterium]